MKVATNKRESIINLVVTFLKRHIGIIAVILLSGIAFVGIYKVVQPVGMDKLEGMHSWLSGSTIKFVNNWLDEGAANLNFTNYENPNSIEFETLEEREPYLSYPTGETFFVYSAARLTGKNEISITFLHRFQIIMFAFEAIIFASFIYLLLKRTVNMRGEIGKIFISVISAVLWTLLPVCMYYLTNIYFADQCVILWTMGLTLIEYAIRTSKGNNNWLKFARAIVIYSGILIDYYFWILAFLFFAVEFVNVFLANKKGERKNKILDVLFWFGIPAVLAVLTYYLQLSRTDGWFGYMMDKYGIRVEGKDYTIDRILGMIGTNFEQAFSLGNGTIGYLVVLIVASCVGGVVLAIKRKNISGFIRNPGVSIVSANVIAIVLQIFLFKQHSAIHEFSMIKVGWFVALLPLILALQCSPVFGMIRNNELNKNENSKMLLLFSGCYLLIFFAVGLPISMNNYRMVRKGESNYKFERVILENTNYEDVVFSYSEEILANPPQSLAISKKRVYKIDEVNDIVNTMPQLENANALLFVRKDTVFDKETKDELECLKEQSSVRIETDWYYLRELNNNYIKCQRN